MLFTCFAFVPYFFRGIPSPILSFSTLIFLLSLPFLVAFDLLTFATSTFFHHSICYLCIAGYSVTNQMRGFDCSTTTNIELNISEINKLHCTLYCFKLKWEGGGGNEDFFVSVVSFFVSLIKEYLRNKRNWNNTQRCFSCHWSRWSRLHEMYRTEVIICGGLVQKSIVVKKVNHQRFS